MSLPYHSLFFSIPELSLLYRHLSDKELSMAIFHFLFTLEIPDVYCYAPETVKNIYWRDLLDKIQAITTLPLAGDSIITVRIARPFVVIQRVERHRM